MTAAARDAVSAPAATALYVHFPFCLSVCPYCDFVVYAGAAARGPRSRVDTLVAALEREVELRAPARQVGLRSIYLGGGTPSLMSPAHVHRLLCAADLWFGIAADCEVTLEVNPRADDRGDLAGMRAAGVNRLSIGAQSMADVELRALGRRHAASDVVATVAAARAAGLDNVSVDLLYDVPGQTLVAWRTTLEAILRLQPEHVSAYALTLDDPDAEGLAGPTGDHLPLRPGARRWRAAARKGQDEDRAADMYLLADEMLGGAGLHWYEISNWARSGRESRHNLVYWLGGAWEAVGPGAHAFDGVRTRRWNSAPLEPYLAALGKDQLPPGGAETTDQQTAASERTMLRLRTATGIAWAGSALSRASLDRALEDGLLEPLNEGRYRLTPTGRLLSNHVLAQILPA